MRTVQSSEAATDLTRLLADVEGGETIVITRDGRAIARLVPEIQAGSDLGAVKRGIAAFRQTMPRLGVAEILSARHEGRKY